MKMTWLMSVCPLISDWFTSQTRLDHKRQTITQSGCKNPERDRREDTDISSLRPTLPVQLNSCSSVSRAGGCAAGHREEARVTVRQGWWHTTAILSRPDSISLSLSLSAGTQQQLSPGSRSLRPPRLRPPLPFRRTHEQSLPSVLPHSSACLRHTALCRLSFHPEAGRGEEESSHMEMFPALHWQFHLTTQRGLQDKS